MTFVMNANLKNSVNMKLSHLISGRISPSRNPHCIRYLALMVSLGLLLSSTFDSSQVHAQTGVYTLNGGTDSQTDQTFAATLTDESAVYVLNSGQLTLTNCTMTKTGDASDINNSSQYGINAGILATSASQVTISGGSVITNASGANGIFATGSGSAITMSNAVINASGEGAHGVDATYGGMITLQDVDITTTGASSSALATDFGGGTVTVTGGTIVASATASGSHSAGIYSTGTISVTDATVRSDGDCGGVIDGANSIHLTNTSLTGAEHGFKLWKTAPASGSATVTISGGNLNAGSGDDFYITGETGNPASAQLSVSNGAGITTGTGNIVNVINSSTASFSADDVTLEGDFFADETSTLSVQFQHASVLTGSAQNTGITMDGDCAWTVTANSVMTTVIDPDGISGMNVLNITGNGFNIHYDSSLAENEYLGGLTYSLVNGGILTPGDVLGIESGDEYGYTIRLDQNFPNPAVISTTITYFLPNKSEVKLNVFNQHGQEIETLVSSDQPAGNYSVVYPVAGLNEGVYFYRLTASGVILTRKLLVIK